MDIYFSKLLIISLSGNNGYLHTLIENIDLKYNMDVTYIIDGNSLLTVTSNQALLS